MRCRLGLATISSICITTLGTGCVVSDGPLSSPPDVVAMSVDTSWRQSNFRHEGVVVRVPAMFGVPQSVQDDKTWLAEGTRLEASMSKWRLRLVPPYFYTIPPPISWRTSHHRWTEVIAGRSVGFETYLHRDDKGEPLRPVAAATIPVGDRWLQLSAIGDSAWSALLGVARAVEVTTAEPD